MKKRGVLLVSLLICLSMLISCDPIYPYPTGELKVAKIAPITQGSSIEIEIVYPNIGGSIVLDWKDQCAEIISGEDIVAVSGLTITELKPGIAIIKVSATTVLTDGAYQAGDAEQTYTTEVEIRVK